MSEAFLKVVNMSISAGWLVLAVLALRLILKKAPKWIFVLLWGIVAVRLICPFSIESALSLIPSTETISPEIMMDWTPEISTGISPLDQVVNPVISTSFAPNPGTSGNPLQILIPVAANLWVLGVIIMLAYTAISYLTLLRKLRTAVILRGNMFQCEAVSSPFVLGILKPRIYLPYAMDGKNLDHVIAHEQAHIQRKDHWWKPLGFLLLTVYWFNPLMWVAYIMLCRDIELACDEKVISELGNEQRADYTQALVACAVNRRMIAACPLAFGEVGVKDRVKSIMNYRKPTFWIIVTALVVCVVVAVCFLTDPFTPSVFDVLYQDNFYVLSQEARDITLSVPKDRLTEEIYTAEGYEFGENEVVVYKTDTTKIYLSKVMLSNESDDQLYFAFDISYNIVDKGTLLAIYSRVSDDRTTLMGGLKSKDLRDDSTVYTNAVNFRGSGPESQLWFYVSVDACKKANGNLIFETVFNEIEFETVQRGRTMSMVGMNVSDLEPTLISRWIQDSEGWDSSNVYMNSNNFSLTVDSDFNWVDSQAVRYFFSNAKKTYSSQLRIFPDEDKFFLTERTEWNEQEQKFLLQHYLEAIKYLPQEAIREMAPADKYIIQLREEGRPSDYNRVITYSSEGVEDTDGWYIHLQIQPLHADGGAYSGTGDEVLDMFYGESYGSVATPDNIAFGLYDLEGENAEITEVRLRNLHNGKDTVITAPDDIQSITEFFTKVQGANRTSSKGYYGGSYEVQLCNGSRTVLSIGFGDDDSFNCGDYGDGYPARYELWGVTREDVIRFFSQYDSSDFEWGLPSVLNAKLLEIHDGYFLVEPVEGSWELNSASKIEIFMKNMHPSPEPQVGDILEIEYDGQLQETYPARISNPYSIRVVKEAETWDLIPMVMVNGTLYLDTGMESTVEARCGMMDGEITSQVDGSKKPSIDDQSNFGTGYGYQYGATEGTIELYMNGKWWIFATEEARQVIQFPSTDENLIKKISKDLELPAGCSLSYIGEYSDGSNALLWFAIDGNYPDRYVAVECEKQASGKYKFIDAYSPMTYAQDIVHVVWKAENIFLVNNRDCSQIVYMNEAREIIQEIDVAEYGFPYIFRLSMPTNPGICSFIDANGEEIR